MKPIDAQSRPALAPGTRLQTDRVTGDPVLLSPEGILKMWLSIVPASSEQYLKTISSLFRMPGDKS